MIEGRALSHLAKEATGCLLRLKVEATRTELHHWEGPTSDYLRQPLVVLSRDDLAN